MSSGFVHYFLYDNEHILCGIAQVFESHRGRQFPDEDQQTWAPTTQYVSVWSHFLWDSMLVAIIHFEHSNTLFVFPHRQLESDAARKGVGGKYSKIGGFKINIQCNLHNNLIALFNT